MDSQDRGLQMANDLRTRYEIELEINGADRARSQCADIDRQLEAISKNAKSLKFKDALQGVEALEHSMQDLLKSEGDCTAQWAEFERTSTKAYNDLEKEAVRLNFSISDQGKLQRERIKELEQEKAALGSTKEEKARAREIDKEIKEIRKQVVDMSDEDLKAAQNANVQARARLKIMQNEAKQQKTQAKQQKTLKQLIADDLKPLRDKIKAQKEFIQSLKTTEGRYNALKKASKTAFSVGKTALKGAGIAAGLALGAVGAVIGSGENQVAREEQVNRIKAGSSRGAKRQLMEDVFVDAGGSNDEVVDAINRVYSVLGKDASLEDVRTAAAMELKYPGLTKMFLQQNVGKVGASDYVAAANRTRATQEYSGATKEQIQSASDYVSNLRQNKFTNASQMELRDLYLALQGSGGFDSDEELQRAFNDFVRVQMQSNQDVFTLAKQWQEEGRWIRTAYGNTNKTQAANAIQNIDFRMLATNHRITDYTNRDTAADSAAKTARRVSLLKDQVLLQILQGLEPFLKSGALQKLITMVMDMIQSETFQNILKMISELLNMIIDLVAKIVKVVSPFTKQAVDATVSGARTIINYISSNGKGEMETIETSGGTITVPKRPAPQVGVSGQARANGGIASMPSVFGEAGPEIAIPLDPARDGRAQQLSAYVTNNFNMSGNETSTLALAGALNSREWAYQSSRIGQLNRRLGR
jgi:hypothetical protein